MSNEFTLQTHKTQVVTFAVKQNHVCSLLYRDICMLFCCFCDKVVSLSGLGKHVNNTHQVTLKEYKALFGIPQHQIIKLVFHKCCLCRKAILLKTDELSV